MSQPNTDVLDLKQILVQFNSKCIDIYEARHTYSTAELITADLDKEYGITLAKIQELYVLKSDVEEALELHGLGSCDTYKPDDKNPKICHWCGESQYSNVHNVYHIRTKLNLNKES